MKKLLVIILMISSFAKAQEFDFSTGGQYEDTSFYSLFYFPTYPIGHQQRLVFKIKDTMSMNVITESVFFNAVKPAYWGVRPNSILHTNTNGKLLASSIDSVYLQWGQILNAPEVKRTETHVGATNSSGDYTVTFSTSYTGVPFVAASIYNASVNQFVRVTNVTQTGFTVNAYGFDTVGSALQIDTTPIGSVTVYVFVSE